MDEDGISVVPTNASDENNEFINKNEVVRAVVGVTCCLSIIGSILITMSYVCFKSLRSKARLILVHISIMDFGVAAANLIGLVVYFDQYYRVVSADDESISVSPDLDSTFVIPPSDRIEKLCVSQAFFGVFFTLGSVAWTVSLALYLYFALVYYDKKQREKMFQVFAYTFSYGLPLVISLWLVLTGKLGYSPYDSSGWCTIILVDPATKEKDIYAAVLGYDLWIYLAILLVPLLYLSLKGYLVDQYDQNKDYVSEKRFWEAVYILDYKFMLIPLTFTVLRVWSCIVNVLYVYSPSTVGEHMPPWITELLIYLSGIGDSGQGIANAFLFILCTSKVRHTFQNKLFSLCPSGFCWKSEAVRLRAETVGSMKRPYTGSSAERTPIHHSSSVDLNQGIHVVQARTASPLHHLK